MELRSSAFEAGSAIPRLFTCDGEDLSPPLEWGDVPKETRSFALLCVDPDAPAGTWHHWAAYDIPVGQTSLTAGAGNQAPDRRFRQAVNDFHRVGYGGPCPPHGHGAHHYTFSLFALSEEQLLLPRRAICRDVGREARRCAIAEARLTGLYAR